jgi:hypothetical protein
LLDARSRSGGSSGDKYDMPIASDKTTIKNKHELVIGFVI